MNTVRMTFTIKRDRKMIQWYAMSNRCHCMESPHEGYFVYPR